MFSDNTILIVVLVSLIVAALVYYYANSKPSEIQKIEPSDSSTMLDIEGGNQVPPMLVLFHAPWCGHCKNILPTWEDVRQNFDGYNGIRIVKVNGDENPQVTALHGVTGFPTIKFLPNGIESVEGAVTYNGDRSHTSLVQFLQAQK